MKNPTLRKKFIPKLLLILLPLVIFVNICNFNITHVLRDQAASSGSEFSTIYMREIDASLINLRHWLVNLSDDKERLAKLSSDDASEREQERRYYSELLQGAVELHPTLDMAFVISTKYPYTVTSTSKNVTFEEYQTFDELAKSVAEYRKPFNTDWTAMPVPGRNECWLISAIVRDDVVLGIIVKPQTLLSAAPFALDTKKKFVLAKHSGTVVMTTLPKEYGDGIDLTGDLSSYYMTGSNGNIIVSGAESKVGPFRLMSITSDAEIQSSISWVKWIFLVLLAISLITLIGVVVGFNSAVLKPLEKVDSAIKKFGQAKFDQHLVPKNEAREFVDIYNTFNRMTDQIETLKIENYEQLIQKQQAELRFYQTQIKPHFILNCLTTIQNLSKQGKAEELARFISDFSSFARYMFRTDFTLVSLHDELEQVKHYISMQELRYPDQVFYVSETDNALSGYQIPAMLIQTLVENSVKHGLSEETGISIFVQCKETQIEGKTGIQISVEDNGDGFPEEVLTAINDAHADQSVLGFGLQNVSAVLGLIYGDAATMQAENIPGSGAKVVITIIS
jgi:two-component system sensor histidine kinase YesM